MNEKFFMVVIVEFNALEISEGDAGYRADTIVESIKKLGGVTSAEIAGGVHRREEEK